MVARARLIPGLPATPKSWPNHKVKWSSVGIRAALGRGRRLDAETFLSDGYQVRLAIERKKSGWVRFGELANAWTPPRIKMVLVSKEHGAPYLNTSQVFGVRPAPRKWLSMEKTGAAERRLVGEGVILVMASASPGESTVTTKAHVGAVISHHFMRLDLKQGGLRGWIYGFLKSPQGLAMMRGSQYASIIRHIEPHQMAEIPVPEVAPKVAADFEDRLVQIISTRNTCDELQSEAERQFEKAVGALPLEDLGESGFSVRASETVFAGRRRFDAASHNPALQSIRHHFATRKLRCETVSALGYEVWLPMRFKRIPAEDGVWLVDTSALTEVNPRLTKRIAETQFGDAFNGRVREGWILMPRSGQVYGILGTPVIARKAWEDCVVSDDAIRVRPTREAKVRPGYLATALGHPTLGRPLVKALAYGSSIPHIDPSDLANLDVVRLGESRENAIADLAERAATAQALADELEQQLGEHAGRLIDKFTSR